MTGIAMHNAFTSVRPRGADTAPAKVPKKPKKAPVPITYSKQPVKVLNARGFFQAPLNPNAASIVIEGREAGQASADKRRAITRGLS